LPPVIYWAHLVGSWLMRFVPVRLVYWILDWATPLFLAFFARAHFERAAANMRQVVGPNASEHTVRGLTRAAFTNYARYMVDLLRLPYVDTTQLAKNVAIHGWDNVEAAFAQGLGVVIVTGHIGSWDLAGAAFVGMGRNIGVLTDTLKPPRWNERVQRIRNHVGMRAIPIESGVREMLATLRRHEGLAVLVDKPLSSDGVPVCFFGRTTRVPSGAATLALRTGSPVLPAVLLHDPAGLGYVAYIGEPIPTRRAQRSPSDVQELTQRVMVWLEGIIREYPDQWYMFRSMWPEPARD
jgi:KDO2-lipid IV(A) lauroyltransferase